MKKINLSIPQPCHEDWNKMTQEAKGKFCSSCQKTVIDFTNMSDRQLAEFFKKPVSSVCGRFQQEQLDRDILIPRKRIPWIKYFFQFVLPAFLISMKANAQKGKVAVKGDAILCTRTLGIVAPRPIDTSHLIAGIKGKVVDEKGIGISYASIVIKETNKNVVCDAEGNFKILKFGIQNVLVVTSVGFEQQEVKLNKDNPVEIIMHSKSAIMDTLIIASFDNTIKGRMTTGAYSIIRKSYGPIPAIKKIIDTAFTKFSIYPNPVERNATLKINLKKVETGEYNIAIINNAGSIMQSNDAIINYKNQTLDFNLNVAAAGNYFVRFTNKKSGKYYTEKIIVQ